MKPILFKTLAVLTLCSNLGACCRTTRLAEDITPGNPCTKMDWRYGAADIRIQTSKITSQLMDRWLLKTGCPCHEVRPRIIITQIDNRTDGYISTDMIRDIIEGVAVDDGRFTIVVGDVRDERELDAKMGKIRSEYKYANLSQLQDGQATAPKFLAKVRITKAVNSDRRNDYEDYRMTITLYDIETQEVVDSAWDVLSKRVRR